MCEQQAGNLRFVHLAVLPLTDIHPHALDAAKASEIAGEAGKFWEMHDALYTSAAGLGREELAQAAAQVGLNPAEFAARLSDEQTYATVRADVDGIRPTGIHHTPTLFLNGEQYIGPVEPIRLNGGRTEDAGLIQSVETSSLSPTCSVNPPLPTHRPTIYKRITRKSESRLSVDFRLSHRRTECVYKGE